MPQITKSSSNWPPLILLSCSFLLWGVLRALDDQLVALFNASGELRYATAMLVHMSFFSGYLCISIPAGIYLRRYGYRRAIILSLALMALGSAICVPGVRMQLFPVCLAGIFLFALGIAALQTAGNPCIGLLGADHSATARLMAVQGVGSIGSICGSLMGLALFGHWSLHSGLAHLRFPGILLGHIYLGLSAAIVLVAIAVGCMRFPAVAGPLPPWIAHTSYRNLLRRRQVLFGAAAVFLYVGTEATLLGFSIPYLSHFYASGFMPGTAAALLSIYWAASATGRMAATGILRCIHTRTLLLAACSVSFSLVLCGVLCGGSAGGLCVLVAGLSNALIAPSIFTLSVTGLREEELPYASGWFSTAICGGAAMPLLSGILSARFGLLAAFLLPLAAYVFIAAGSRTIFRPEYQLQHELEPTRN